MLAGRAADPQTLPIPPLSADALIEKLRANELTFKSLHRQDRLAVVYALSPDHTQGEIAQLLGCSRDTVKADIRLIRNQSARLVTTLTVDKQAGELIRIGTWLSTKAAAKHDYVGAWKILKELNEQLQSMGLVKRNPLQVDINLQGAIKQIVEHATPEDIHGICASLRESVHARRN